MVGDILEGRIGLMFTPASTVLAHVRSGKLRALATIARNRIPALPEVPTLSEAGVPGFDAGLWFGLNAPAATPVAVLERLNQETNRVLGLAQVREQLAKQSIFAAPGTRDAFGAFIRQETDKWARVVQAAGVKVE